ncbi:thioredoxin domain-containing protein [Christiangramia sabulilitoris]|uniref:Thioredoxin domain-containing protein n=1 Tax=Christiangramia sabulilitoris TaxID=2583991 RepID=A0A550I844_9FLAO|nr:thioredoxin domain-containing protein [Christiangramia sabulilitoris]TRO67147.1 thioredoxin domain-containing protein [Christiangramia sabulilitoris]
MNSAFRSLILISFFLLLIGCKKSNSSQEATGNRLSKASSPYLKEHEDNPVDWYEWGYEPLEKAQKENKPIIISVGYSACHWCHVMEEETFMDSSVAELMNKEFVSIKVDREERPDIDKIYMEAAQRLNGSSGWPLNIIALPDGKPFYAGTYFPKDQWEKVLKQVARTYNEDKSEFVKVAQALAEGVRLGNSLDTLKRKPDELYTKSSYSGIIKTWKERLDMYNGGYKGGQKFPLPVSWNALLQHYYLTGDEEVLKAVNLTLDKMSRGGIYDHLGGGFARYTTDSKWLVPHFEKMLYDNAQLISVYSNAYKITKNPEYARIIRETIAFVERELANGSGGYYSSMNADSNGKEGEFYVWKKDEIVKLLNPEEAEIFLEFYNIESYGNWEEGDNILYTNYSEKEFAEKVKMQPSEVNHLLSSARNRLIAARNKRTAPATDRKIITSWNALMIQAYLDAYTALGQKAYLEKAEEAAEFIEANMLTRNNRIFRSYLKGESKISGFLDDYSYTAIAFLNLYQVSFNDKWLDKAEKIVVYTIAQFEDKDTRMFYYTSNDQEQLFSRQFDIDDNVIPSSNSVMAMNLMILGEFKANAEYSRHSKKMLLQVLEQVEESPSFYANWSRLLGMQTYGIYEVAILGEEAASKNAALQSNYYPTSLFMGGVTEHLPLLKGKLKPGVTLIYVCQNKTCKYPVSNVDEARQLLGDQNAMFSEFF